jgi:hypothetical protein
VNVAVNENFRFVGQTKRKKLTSEVSEQRGGQAVGNSMAPNSVLALEGRLAEQFVDAELSAAHRHLGPVGERQTGVRLQQNTPYAYFSTIYNT